MADAQDSARHRRTPSRLVRVVVIGVSVMTTAAIALTGGFHGRAVHPAAPRSVTPPKPGTLVGIFVPGVPQSYAGVRAFTATTQVRPKLLVYYSGWTEPFQARFAAAVARHGAVPLVQIDPTGVSLTAIANGQYDAYLHSYASDVEAFSHRVILSFGPEMNGSWYTWGYRHTSPAVFVAAWQHIVTVFRRQGAANVTWLWTVNVIHKRGIPSPDRWWPGNSYVNWVGIDGYYLKRSWTFASLFGPTIKAVRVLTLDRILISETSATPAAGKAAKIADLFAGVCAYGLLGFVWFDTKKRQDWSLSTPDAFAAFRRGARS